MEIKNNLLKNKQLSTKCCICGYLASGYLYYNVNCCDGCKHFFRRCIIIIRDNNSKELFKCKDDGNCKVENVPYKCKSCRFDKCLLMGMNLQKLRGKQTKSSWEINAIIEERIRELANKGKYILKKMENNKNVGQSFGDLKKSLNEGKDYQIIEYLLAIEKNASRIRNSPTNVPEWHYVYSCKSLNILLTQTENLLSYSHEYLEKEQKPTQALIDFLHKYGHFHMRPTTLAEDLLLIVDIAKTMPFFTKLDLNDNIYLLTIITLPILVLVMGYHSYRKNSETCILPCGISTMFFLNGEFYEGDLTMEPFNRVKLNEEEYVLIRAIIYSHMVTNGLSKSGQEILLNEAEKYSKILLKMLQNNYGPISGARRYAELLQLIEFCFNCARYHNLLLNYFAFVRDRGSFHNVMPEALADLCLRTNVKLPELTQL
uniref:Nuclear receptor domain-containing protein n=1 Tax=Meloidogyne hapla TaxID=6305 RepID=A0A1I8BQ00_MELHA